VSWLFASREFTNYTYHLTGINKKYLAAFVAHVTGISHQEAKRYIDELAQDVSLREHIRRRVQGSSEASFADAEMPFGRRMGWYGVVRAVKPRIVVETGVDKGLGSCVLTAALQRNAQEGHEGYYYGTDINPKAGYLLTGEYARFGEIRYGDSIESLKSLDVEIDVFVNDSDHATEYESREYVTVESKLSKDAIIIGDNSRDSDELLRFAERTGREFLYFQEEPDRHWFPGAGLGVAYLRDR
jgi:hypothetical protein